MIKWLTKRLKRLRYQRPFKKFITPRTAVLIVATTGIWFVAASVGQSIRSRLFMAFLGMLAIDLVWGVVLFASSFERQLRLDDPIFGPLRGARGADRNEACICWWCDRNHLFQGQAAVNIFTEDEAGPTERQRLLYLELERRYTELGSIITEPLAKEYVELRVSLQMSNSKALGSSREIWDIASLTGVEINSDDLVLRYDIDWDDLDHTLNVVVSDWKVVQVMFEG